MSNSDVQSYKHSAQKKVHRVGRLLLVVIDDDIAKQLHIDEETLLELAAMPDGSIVMRKTCKCVDKEGPTRDAAF